MAKVQYVPDVDLKRCKGCGLCVAFCPKQVFESDFEGKPVAARPETCVGCMGCDYRRPDFAITLRPVGREEEY